MGYEHLSDFCFCYGHIGHNFQEYGEYKGQLKIELSYGIQMKTIKVGEKAKHNRKKKKSGEAETLEEWKINEQAQYSGIIMKLLSKGMLK